MMSNFYNPWHNTYTQTSFQQNLLNCMIYSQFYSTLTYNQFPFLQNHFQQNPVIINEFESLQEKISTKDKKSSSEHQICHQNSKKQLSPSQEIQQLNDAMTRQKYGRNITSNIFRSLLKRLSNPSRFKKLFQQIVQQKKINLSYENFLQQIDKLSCKLKSYVKRNEMKKFFFPETNQKQRTEFCLVFRIMSKIYLKQEHTVSIFHSKKINKQSRNLHFVLIREMQALFK